MDLLIAATAHDAAVYTRDAEDLIGLETLIEVVSP
jgi:predicted nucleic acid-binding protein